MKSGGNDLLEKIKKDNLFILRTIVVIVIILAIILPYFGLIQHSRAPIIIVPTGLLFGIIDEKFGNDL